MNETVTVTVKYFADLKAGAHPPKSSTLPAGTRLGDMLSSLSLEGAKLIVVLNGRVQQGYDAILKHEDVVALFSPLAGG